jgi:hypothetical protein
MSILRLFHVTTVALGFEVDIRHDPGFVELAKCKGLWHILAYVVF